MNQIISKIYPNTKNSRYAVDSVYLRKMLIFRKNPDKPMYYANFLTSLDGRIATYNYKYKQLKQSCLKLVFVLTFIYF